MTTAIRRPAMLAAAATALVVGLTSCGTGPSQVNAAVIIDDQRISVDDVQAVLDKVIKEQPAAKPLAQQHKLDLVAREIVTQLIMHELVTDAARDEGLRVDGEEIAKLMRDDPLGDELPTDGSVPADALATQLVYRARDHREVVTDQILLSQLGAEYRGLAVTMDYVTVVSDDPGAKPASMRDKAEAKGREFAANPDGVDDLINRELQQNPQAGAVGQQFVATEVPQDQLDLLSTVLFGTPRNEVIVFQPSAEQALWVVGLIRERETDAPVENADALPEPDAQQLIAIGERLLQPYVSQADIQISPRYGVWDPVAMGVAPSEAEQSGLVLPAKTARQ